ncbi:MAG TPA: type III-B CRISPR module-associated protein Cmr5, partial [Dehalococcoidia bacterium]|nr:type III-B CRISPR module-associated protein Cmr5 [Dehalococcoidia bacterium]
MSAKSLQKTLEQQRARRAWDCVQEVTNQPQDFKKKYSSLARKVPMLVLTNGLGQTLAFLLSKAKRHEPENKRSVEAKAHDLLFTHLSNWVL